MLKTPKVNLQNTLFFFSIIFAIWGFCNPFIIRAIFLDKNVNLSVQDVTYSDLTPISGVKASEVNTNQPISESSYPTHKELGPIGDWLGGTSTPLLTIAGFLMIIATFILQNKQLKSSQREVHEQKYTLGRQRFDSTFFNMVQLHNEIVKSMAYTRVERSSMSYTESILTPVQKSGRERLVELIDAYGINSNAASKEQLTDRYENLYKKNDDLLGHYFRNLYNLIKIIDESEEIRKFNEETGALDSESTKNERKRYTRIIRSQLSFSELLLIFYNSLTENGTDFYKFIVEYKLLNNIKVEKIPKAMHETFIRMEQK
jgi:hypothetical protein